MDAHHVGLDSGCGGWPPFLPTELIVDDLDRWLPEDGLNESDITSEVLFGASEQASMRLIAKKTLTVCGLELGHTVS